MLQGDIYRKLVVPLMINIRVIVFEKLKVITEDRTRDERTAD